MLKTLKVTAQCRAAHDNFGVATTCLELAYRAKEKWEIDHHCITGITFTAFAIEAMLNHFGQIYFKDWNKLKLPRKDLHKKLFKAANLDAYLSAKTYQQAKYCFELRDGFAHGKTIEETLDVDIHDANHPHEIVCRAVSLQTQAFRKIDYNLFKQFVNVARQIENDIQNNGFYPETENLPLEFRGKLCECPLSSSGIRTW
tara:strand:+ start:9170 stop:9769 length:600 start_codon:yes stop_codon:yes gene_type:complete